MSSKHGFDDVFIYQRIFQSMAQSITANCKGFVQCKGSLSEFTFTVSVTESQPWHQNAIGNHLAGKQSAQLKRGAAVSTGGHVIRVGGWTSCFEDMGQTVFLCFLI